MMKSEFPVNRGTTPPGHSPVSTPTPTPPSSVSATLLGDRDTLSFSSARTTSVATRPSLATHPVSPPSMAKRLWPLEDQIEYTALVHNALTLVGGHASEASMWQIVPALRKVPVVARRALCDWGATIHKSTMTAEDTVTLIGALSSKTPVQRNQFRERLNRSAAAWNVLEHAISRSMLTAHARQGLPGLNAYSEHRDLPMLFAAWALHLKPILAAFGEGSALPNFFETEHASNLTNVLGYTFSPLQDELANNDYATVIRLAPQVYETLLEVGNALANGNFSRAASHARALVVNYREMINHQNGWLALFAFNHWQLYPGGLTMDESEFHHFMVNPSANLIWPQEDWNATQAVLEFEIQQTPRSWQGLLALVPQLKENLLHACPDESVIINNVFDLDELQQADLRGVLDASAVYSRLHLAINLVSPGGVSAGLVQRYGNRPEALLPEAIVFTCKSVWNARNAKENQRIRDEMPNVLAQGLAWERSNFEARMAHYNGRMPRTERWLASVPPRQGESMRSWHGRAVTHFLFNTPGWDDAHVPETLALAQPFLRACAHHINTATRAAVGELLLSGLLRAHGTALSRDERDTVLTDLMMLPHASDRQSRAVYVYERILEACATLFARRNMPVNMLNLVDAHTDTMMADLTDYNRSVGKRMRQQMAQHFAQQLERPNLHDDPNEIITPLTRVIEGTANSIRRVLDLDLQVHAEHYSALLQRLPHP